MWTLNKPNPVKLIIGILAADEKALAAAEDMIAKKFGDCDMKSPAWPFVHTNYYKDEAGENIIKKFVTVDKLIYPDRIAAIKLKTNKMEQKLAKMLKGSLPRPVNLDPGYIETSKLVLATTKNYSHRIYLKRKIWAEVTLIYNKGAWESFGYTFPDHKDNRYHDFFNQVREKLKQQLAEIKK